MGLRFSYHNAMNGFESKVFNFIQKHRMTEPGSRIIVGFSGGADSTALLNVLWELKDLLKISITAVHVEHGIRPEAMEDALFAGDFCRKRDIDFVLVREDVPKIAKERHLTEEEAGREVRYNAFEKTLKETGGSRIAVAHHENDVAETLLFNLVRGSSVRGGASIKPVRDNVIRPLLCVSRSQIEDYLGEKGLSYCTDSTNLENIHHRNILRNKILPILEQELNPRAAEHLARAAADFSAADDFIRGETDKAFEEMVRGEDGGLFMDCRELLSRHKVIRGNLILKCIGQMCGRVKDISFAHISSVLELAEDREGCASISLPYGLVAKRVYDRIGICRGEKESDQELKIIPLEADFEETEIEIPVLGRAVIQIIPHKNHTNIPTDTYTKWFDYDRIQTAVFRTRRQGDVIYIEQSGELHQKLLSKYMTDEKIPVFDRDRLYILADGDQVIWIPGYRMSGAYKVSEATRNILAINIINGGNING